MDVKRSDTNSHKLSGATVAILGPAKFSIIVLEGHHKDMAKISCGDNGCNRMVSGEVLIGNDIVSKSPASLTWGCPDADRPPYCLSKKYIYFQITESFWKVQALLRLVFKLSLFYGLNNVIYRYRRWRGFGGRMRETREPVYECVVRFSLCDELISMHSGAQGGQHQVDLNISPRDGRNNNSIFQKRLVHKI